MQTTNEERENQIRLKEWHIEFELKKRKSLQVISELESQCESYQKDIHDVDTLCFLLQSENQALANKISESECVLSEMQSTLEIHKNYSERKSDQLIMQLASTQSEIELLRNVVNNNNTGGSLNNAQYFHQLESEVCASEPQIEPTFTNMNIFKNNSTVVPLLNNGKSPYSSSSYLQTNCDNDGNDDDCQQIVQDAKRSRQFS